MVIGVKGRFLGAKTRDTGRARNKRIELDRNTQFIGLPTGLPTQNKRDGVRRDGRLRSLHEVFFVLHELCHIRKFWPYYQVK